MAPPHQCRAKWVRDEIPFSSHASSYPNGLGMRLLHMRPGYVTMHKVGN